MDKKVEEVSVSWDIPEGTKNPPVNDGDIRMVNLLVEVNFEWSDKIVSDWDDDNNPIEYESGYIMRVLPDQSFVYDDEESILLGRSFTEKPKE